MKRFLAAISAILMAAAVVMAAEDLRNPSEDFIRASVMVASPGDALYSKTGHAFIRMQCPSQNMDFCFSYESEDTNAKILTFLAGKLRMGLVGMRTSEYLSEYEKTGRGVTEYPLSLPVKAKQNLWRVLDRHVDEGMDLPYDYLDRGCAISVMHLLEEATIPQGLTVDKIPSEYTKSRREILTDELAGSPWSRLLINILTNGSANDDVELMEKAITPASLITILSNCSYGGSPILGNEETLLKTAESADTWEGITPMTLSICLALISIWFFFRGNRWILWGVTGLAFLFGLFNFYLVFISHLCATEWSWLIIPFNPLPVILWKYRRKWMMPYGAVCILWALTITLAPGALTDPSLALAAASTGLVYLSEGLRLRPDIQERIASRFAILQSRIKTT